MEKKEKPIIPKIKENKLELLLFILSIIQGLAFTRLIELTIEVLKNSASGWETAVIALHSILCFLIIVRLFETILLGFLDYDEIGISFNEVIMIFIIGAFEYWVIDSLSDFTPSKFYFRIIFLAVLSLAGYIATTIKISGKKNRRKVFEDYSSYRRELKLQAVNITVPAILLAFSIMTITGIFISQISFVIISSILSLLVIMNIVVSWVMTITGPNIIIPWDYQPVIEEAVVTIESKHLKADLTIREAEANNSLKIAELYLFLFPYVFRDVFDMSDRLIVKILSKLVSFYEGKSYYGYRRICLAEDKENGSIAGFISVSDSESNKLMGNIFLGFYAICLILYYTGLWGLYRVAKNTFKNRKASPEIKSDELYISYIGVLTEYRKRKIAQDLLHYAEKLAVKRNKQSIGLDVREDNVPAIQLFLSCGFKEISRIDDGAFCKPPRIYMSKSLKNQQ